MQLFAQHWGFRPWVDIDDTVEPLEIGDLAEVVDPALNGDTPTGADPLDILLALEALEEALSP